jgi:hypothetical protein
MAGATVIQKRGHYKTTVPNSPGDTNTGTAWVTVDTTGIDTPASSSVIWHWVVFDDGFKCWVPDSEFIFDTEEEAAA